MPVRIQDIIDILEENFPLYLAAEWDNPGLQMGSGQQSVSKVLVVMDLDDEVLDYARNHSCELIITHHPLFFSALKSINYEQSRGRLVMDIIKAGITVYSAHTNLDAGVRGINQMLAEKLGLQDISPLDQWYRDRLLKLVVYVPLSHFDIVREAILSAGAGHIGRYQDCSFVSKGTGTFRPQAGTQPFMGQEGILEEVEEYRLETIVPQPGIETVLNKMREVHPYEEIAYDLYPLQLDGQTYSMGRTGCLATPSTLLDFCDSIKRVLDLKYVVVAGDFEKIIRKVAVVSGAGAEFAAQAKSRDCDLLVTGDVKYHQAKDALDMGLAIIDAGHEGTERIMSTHIAQLLAEQVGRYGWDVKIFALVNREVLKIY